MKVKQTDIGVKIDRLTRSKRKTVALEVNLEGKLIVRVPANATDRQVEDLIREKGSWIRAKQAKALRLRMENPARKFLPGEHFLYLGVSYPVVIVSDQKQPLILDDDAFYLVENCFQQSKDIFERWYRAHARQVISERAGMLARQNGFKFSELRVTGAKTRWGSCGSKGALNFSWRIIMAPLEIVDYIVVHEMVHLKHRSHSCEFWRRVAEIEPDYTKHIDWLKENGHLLSID